MADGEQPAQLPVAVFLLLPDHPLHRRESAAAIGLRPVQAGIAGRRLARLPGAGGHQRVLTVHPHHAAALGPAQLWLQMARRIYRDPGPDDVTERRLFRRIIEIHAANPCAARACSCSINLSSQTAIGPRPSASWLARR